MLKHKLLELVNDGFALNADAWATETSALVELMPPNDMCGEPIGAYVDSFGIVRAAICCFVGTT